MENRYGTSSDMIIQEVDDQGVTRLLAIDSKGLYLTSSDKIDKMIADVNRYGVERQSINEKLTGLGLDPVALFNDNKHLIQAVAAGSQSGKKLNPMKASKRG